MTQCERDLRDLYNIGVNVHRCPACTHLVNKGWVCQQCGCDAGVFKAGDYTEEEIKRMQSQKISITD